MQKKFVFFNLKTQEQFASFNPYDDKKIHSQGAFNTVSWVPGFILLSPMSASHASREDVMMKVMSQHYYSHCG